MTAFDVLAQSAGHPDAVALVSGSAVWSYAELSHQVDRRAAELVHESDERGASILEARTTAAGVVELLAMWRRGMVPAPLNARLTPTERAAAEAGLRGVDLPLGTQVVLWTSGTTGNPRGVALSWENLACSVSAVAERLDLSPHDRWLASLSPAHVGGLVLMVRSIVLGGTLLTFEGPHDGFDVDAVSRILDGSGLPEGALPPTHVSLVPTQLSRLLQHRSDRPAPANLSCVLIGGAHAPASLIERAHEGRWPIALTYGTTEMSSQIATAPPALVRIKPGTVGLPLRDTEVRIGADGAIAVRGRTRALAYVGAASAPTPPEMMGGDDWYETGDLGRLDAEGHLWVTGRRGDRIVSGGVTVDALEVEEALRSHPAVLDCCVVGLPDLEWGERVGAWVEPVVGEFDVDDVSAQLRDQLSAAKLPRVWHVAAGLPRNANGKVDRSAVRTELLTR